MTTDMTRENVKAINEAFAQQFNEPSAEEALNSALQRLIATFRQGEQVWLVGQNYTQIIPAWDIDIVRISASGRWVKQRHRYDAQAEVLFYMGESTLNDAEFRAARAAGKRIHG